jgi:hypothetical protein
MAFIYNKKLMAYIMSSALTKNVQTKGRIRVRYSKCLATATPKRAVKSKNNIQYIPVLFFCCSMAKKFVQTYEKGCNEPKLKK